MPPVERHLRVQRTARFWVLGTPGPRTRELWVACHGYGQLASRFSGWLQPLEDPGRVVLVPEALSRFYLDDPAKPHGPTSPVGATWMTREDRASEITDYVDYLDELVTVVRREIQEPNVRVTALGFSQGVATVCRWAALGRTAVDRLILWAGTLPNDLPGDGGDQLFKGASLALVVGTQDRIVPVSAIEREQETLAQRGLSAQVIRFEGAHALSPEILRRLAAEPQ
jgi:predicted esterase